MSYLHAGASVPDSRLTPLIRECRMCARLELVERRLRAAYEGAIRSLDRLGDETSESYPELKKLADEAWFELEAAVAELELHRKSHRTLPTW